MLLWSKRQKEHVELWWLYISPQYLRFIITTFILDQFNFFRPKIGCNFDKRFKYFNSGYN